MDQGEFFQVKGSILTIKVPAELDHHLAEEIRRLSLIHISEPTRP